jgi:short-subunit dehydrogenase
MARRLHVWVTGASRGIGSAIARRLGVHHQVTASARNEHDLAKLNLFAVPCDVADRESVEAAHNVAVNQYGPVDVLVNNAGIGIFKPVVEMNWEEFDDLLDINLRGMFHCTKSVLPDMLARRQGMIIDINSISTLRAFPGNAGYSMTKAGALQFGRAMREEVRDHGIKVVEIIVGATDTDIWHPEPRATHAHRMMQPDDVADVVNDTVEKFSNQRLHVEEIIMRPQLGDL